MKILNKYDDWKGIVIGNEPRQKLFFNHKNLKNLGFKNNKFVLNKLKEVSISVIPSKWDEPFGRSSLEAASRGCAIIRSSTGGLNETSKHSLILKKLTSNHIFNKINYLIKNPNKLKKLQRANYNDFKLTNKRSSLLLDQIRENLLDKNEDLNINYKCLKILYPDDVKTLHISLVNGSKKDKITITSC